jgi:serine phosphatase RsbU (regulator of sigma subunit)
MLIRMRSTVQGWTLELAAAGHPPAIHVKPDGPSQLGGGSVLGAFPSAQVATHEIAVETGETIVLCTDGWLEAGPPETHYEPEALGEMVHRLAGVGLDELTRQLCRDAVSRGGGSLRDDMVVLAIRPTSERSGAGGDDDEDRLLQAAT